MLKSWLFLIGAILFEVVGTTSMKLSQGFSKLWPSILMFVMYGLSLSCEAVAMKRLDVSIVYAIWSGLGTAMIAVIGVILFRESMSTTKLISLSLIILGVIGLNFSH